MSYKHCTHKNLKNCFENIKGLICDKYAYEQSQLCRIVMQTENFEKASQIKN